MAFNRAPTLTVILIRVHAQPEVHLRKNATPDGPNSDKCRFLTDGNVRGKNLRLRRATRRLSGRLYSLLRNARKSFTPRRWRLLTRIRLRKCQLWFLFYRNCLRPQIVLGA